MILTADTEYSLWVSCQSKHYTYFIFIYLHNNRNNKYYHLYFMDEETGSEKLSSSSRDGSMVKTQDCFLSKTIFAHYSLHQSDAGGYHSENFVVSYLYLSSWYFFCYFSFFKVFRHNYGHKSCGQNGSRELCLN